jgi:bacterioferritin
MTRKVFAVAAKKAAGPRLTPAVVRPFLTDVAELRRRARREIEEGAVTPGYGADREAVVRLLNISLATEIVCVLRYKRHYFMADGIHAESVKAEFLEHAKEEQAHADGLCERIRQLGGEPDLNPSGLLSKSHTEYQEGSTLAEMIREDLVAERIAIESYKELIAYVGESDTTTRRLFEWILGQEEEHADDLADLLRSFDGEKTGHR